MRSNDSGAVSPADFTPFTPITPDEATGMVEGWLRLLWSQWTALGVSGGGEPYDAAMIDPEALIIATLRLGRRDPRLFDEALDWCARNGEWISLQRLKNIVRALSPDDPFLAPAAAAFAATLDNQESRGRWRALMPVRQESGSRGENGVGKGAGRDLFLALETGEPLPHFGPVDPIFRRYGLIRPPVDLRGMSAPVPMRPPVCLHLRLRALFGLGARAEVVACLLAAGDGRSESGLGVRELARMTSYSVPAVTEAIDSLARGGFLLPGLRRKNTTGIDRRRWGKLLDNGDNLPFSFPGRVDWVAIFRAVSAIVETALPALMEPHGHTAYLRASYRLAAFERLREQLELFAAETGGEPLLHQAFAHPADLETAETHLTAGVRRFARLLLEPEQGQTGAFPV